VCAASPAAGHGIRPRCGWSATQPRSTNSGSLAPIEGEGQREGAGKRRKDAKTQRRKEIWWGALSSARRLAIRTFQRRAGTDAPYRPISCASPSLRPCVLALKRGCAQGVTRRWQRMRRYCSTSSPSSAYGQRFPWRVSEAQNMCHSQAVDRRSGLLTGRRLGQEFQGHAVDAVTLIGGRGEALAFEDMAQMPATLRT